MSYTFFGKKNRFFVIQSAFFSKKQQKRPFQRSFEVVGEGGLEPPNGFPDRFTVCCNCHYATPP